MWRPAPGLFQHLIPIEREEMVVLPRPPGKGIDTIKPKHVIDPKEMKDRSDCAHALAPPRELVCTHFLPAINRYTPVLTPFLHKGIILKIRLWRRPARPLQHEFIPPREHIGAMITHTKWNIAHQRDVPRFCIRFELAPLLVRDPLHIAEEILPIPYDHLLILGQIAQPVSSSFHRLKLRRPAIPRRAVVIYLH